MKKITISNMRLYFWLEGKILFCRIGEGQDIFCCGAKPIPSNKEEALKVLGNAWIW